MLHGVGAAGVAAAPPHDDVPRTGNGVPLPRAAVAASPVRRPDFTVSKNRGPNMGLEKTHDPAVREP